MVAGGMKRDGMTLSLLVCASVCPLRYQVALNLTGDVGRR